jgi:hypothetical protein
MKKLNALIIGSHNQIELMDSICSNVKSTQFTAIFVDNLDLSFELFQQTAMEQKGVVSIQRISSAKTGLKGKDKITFKRLTNAND